MKKYFMYAVLLTVFIFISCSQKKDNSIGKIISANEFTLNDEVSDSLGAAWNTMLHSNNIDDEVAALKIVKGADLSTQKEYYAILGTTTGNAAKVMCLAELKDDKFYFEDTEVTTAVICYGSGQCNPTRKAGEWFCDDGTGQDSCSLTCRKATVANVRD